MTKLNKDVPRITTILKNSFQKMESNGAFTSTICSGLEFLPLFQTKDVGRGKLFMVGRYGIYGYCFVACVFVCVCMRMRMRMRMRMSVC